MITITLDGMEFYAHHGCFEEERIIGGRFVVDVSIDADVALAAEMDDITQTIDYSAVYQQVKAEMKIASNLIENVAYRIGSRILKEFPLIQNIRVKVCKLNPAVGGQVQQSTASVVLQNNELANP